MRKLQYIFMTLAVLCMASPAFAQTGEGSAPSWVPIGAGIGMAIASGLCGLGQGRVAGSAAEALARSLLRNKTWPPVCRRPCCFESTKFHDSWVAESVLRALASHRSKQANLNRQSP
jgi:hypothetical protein